QQQKQREDREDRVIRQCRCFTRAVLREAHNRLPHVRDQSVRRGVGENPPALVKAQRRGRLFPGRSLHRQASPCWTLWYDCTRFSGAGLGPWRAWGASVASCRWWTSTGRRLTT